MLHAKIEDYKAGYPRFTALLAAHEPFFAFRRFDRIRARLLLLKQDELSILEQRLDEIDQREPSLLFLGKSRCDGNADRKQVLSDIEKCLAGYDELAERTHRVLSYDATQPRDIKSLRNWLDGTGSLAREEVMYLAHQKELVALAPVDDRAKVQLETWVEDLLVHFYPGFRTSHIHDLSTDPNVYISSGHLIQRLARLLLLLLILLLLLMPAIICNVIKTTSIRIVVVILSTICCLLILSGLMKSKTIELTVAAATYATVVIVFISGSGFT